MKTLSFLVLLCGMMAVNALPPEQVAAVKKALDVPAPELPFVAAQLVSKAKPADKQAVKSLIINTVKENRPGAVLHVQRVLDEAVPPANRPPYTPGNTNGNRQVIPPGLNKYGTP